MAGPRIRLLVHGQPATGPERVVTIHRSQMPEDVSRQIGLRGFKLQQQHPDAEVIDVEVSDLLQPPTHAEQALAEALRGYVDSDQHRWACVAYAGPCCLDPEHPDFARLAEVIAAVVRERTGVAL